MHEIFSHLKAQESYKSNFGRVYEVNCRKFHVNIFFYALLLDIFFLLIGSHAKGETSNPYYQFFRDEITSISFVDFRLEQAWAKFNLIGGFADGKYKLKSWQIKPCGQNVYVLYLIFQKRSGSFLAYNQEVKIPFFYQKGVRLVFGTPKGKKIFSLKEREIAYVEKTKNGYRIIRKPSKLEVILPVTNGKVYLTLAFP